MSDFKAKMHQRSSRPLAGFHGPTSKGREGKGREGEGKERKKKGEAKGKRGGEGSPLASASKK